MEEGAIARNFEKMAVLVAIAIFCFLLVSNYSRAVYPDAPYGRSGPLADHFRNAITAKNIAGGVGWASTGYETYPLNPEILTTGPLVVLPASFFVWLFGNELTVPGVSITIVNLLLLAAILFFYKRYVSDAQRSMAFSVGALSFALLVYPYYWNLLLGEVSSLLCLIMAIIILSSYFKTEKINMLIAAGFTAGLAVLGKQLAALCCVGMTASVLFYTFFYLRKSLLKTFSLTAIFALLWLIPAILFNLYKYIVLSSMDPAWLLGYQDYADRIFNDYSGLDSLKETLFGEGEFTNRLSRVVKQEYLTASIFYEGSWLGKFALPCWLSLYAVLLIKMIKKIKHHPEIFVSVLTVMPLIVWCFLITDNAFPRYFYISLSIVSFSCIFLISAIQSSLARVAVMMFFVFLLVISISEDSRKSISQLAFDVTNYELDIRSALEYVKNSDRPLAMMAARDGIHFEYLLEGINNFESVIFVIGDAVKFDEKAYLEKYPQVVEAIKSGQYKSAMDYYTNPDLKGPHVAPVEIVKPISFDWVHDKTRAEIEKQGNLCRQVVFQNSSFIVERCVTEDIANHFSASGGMPMRPLSWLKPKTNRPEWNMYLF